MIIGQAGRAIGMEEADIRRSESILGHIEAVFLPDHPVRSDPPIIADLVAETAHGHQMFHPHPLMVQRVKARAMSVSMQRSRP